MFSVRHTLHVPEKNLSQADEKDTHHIVRITKKTKDKEFTSDNMSVEVIDEIKLVTSPFFSTDKLTKFCFVAATGSQECRHSHKMYLSFLRRKRGQSCPHPTDVFCYTETDREAFKQTHLLEHGQEEAMVPQLLNLSRCHDYRVYLASNENKQTWQSWAASFSPWHVPGECIGSLDHDDVLNQDGRVRISKLGAFPLDDCRNLRQIKIALKPTLKTGHETCPLIVERDFHKGINISGDLNRCQVVRNILRTCVIS